MIAKAKAEAASSSAAAESVAAEAPAASADDAAATAATQAPAPEAAAPAPAPAPAFAPVTGPVKVRYNHYNDEFPTIDGILDFEKVDAKYSISFVFKGEWTCYLTRAEAPEGRIYPTGGHLQKEMRPDPDGFNSDDEEEVVFGTFSGLELTDAAGNVNQYVLNVDEDPADANKPKTVYKASGGGVKGMRTGGEEGDGMGGEDSASCSCLFGNPCASSYNCKDWKNRWEVAKRNGWKGFS